MQVSPQAPPAETGQGVVLVAHALTRSCTLALGDLGVLALTKGHHLEIKVTSPLLPHMRPALGDKLLPCLVMAMSAA